MGGNENATDARTTAAAGGRAAVRPQQFTKLGEAAERRAVYALPVEVLGRQPNELYARTESAVKATGLLGGPITAVRAVRDGRGEMVGLAKMEMIGMTTDQDAELCKAVYTVGIGGLEAAE